MLINEQNASAVFQAAAQRDQYSIQRPDHNNHPLSQSRFPQGVNRQTDPTDPTATLSITDMWK